MPSDSVSEETSPPAVLPLFISHVLLVGGILIYIVWTALYLIPMGRLFDVGLFSICAVMTLFGLVGHFLYKNIEKTASGSQ